MPRAKHPAGGEAGGAGAVYSPTVICLVSRLPFVRALRAALRQFYRVARSSASPVPLERFVASFVWGAPVPPRGCVQVNVTLGDATVRLARPPRNALPLATGQLFGFLVELVLQFHQFGRLLDSLDNLRIGQSFLALCHAQTEGEILCNGHVRI